MLVLSAAGQLLLERVLEQPGPVARAAVGVASASLAAEMFAWSERNPETTAARAFHRPGHEIQRLIATKEPTPEQLEVGVAALREILRVEQEAEQRREPQPSDPLPAYVDFTARARPDRPHRRRHRRPRGALALYEQTLGMPLAHRETVESQGVEAALLDVGDGHVELLRPLGPDTPVGKYLGEGAPACITSPMRSATSTMSWTSSRRPASS